MSISETVQFVSEFFDDTFGSVIDKPDERIQSLRKYCKTLAKMRKDRIKKVGSVIISVQIMDSLKYVEAALLTLVKRLESKEIVVFSDDNISICDVMIASFGKTNSYWKKPISEFVELMSDWSNTQKYNHGTSEFYLRALHDSIIKEPEGVEYIIFGIVTKNDEESYDYAHINVIGVPNSRKKEIEVKFINEMFGY